VRSLASRKTRLVFETDDAIFERGHNRQIVIEARPGYCYLRLKGSRRRFPICYAAIFHRAVEIATDQARRDKAAKKKATKR
jgi:hypothetical protein